MGERGKNGKEKGEKGHSFGDVGGNDDFSNVFGRSSENFVLIGCDK